MIRHFTSRADLEARVDTELPGWRTRAEARTNAFVQRRAYFQSDAEPPFWAELRPVFHDLQLQKCAYCERSLHDLTYGVVDMEIEHYRPRKVAHGWPSATVRRQYGHLSCYTAQRGGTLKDGYYLLSYDLCNLALACLRCNSRRVKGTYFPVPGARVECDAGGTRSEDYAAEDPDLLFPVGPHDQQDPEQSIGFVGLSAIPIGTIRRARERARITIDILHLNQRDELIRERCRVVHAVQGAAHLAEADDPARRSRGERYLAHLTHRAEPHSRCAQDFLALWQNNRPRALRLGARIEQILLQRRSP